jgi:hypothetical protein
MNSCPQCGGPMIQRSRAGLLAVGFVMAAAPLLAHFVPLLWVPALISFLAGAYLVAWATIGKGQWCRQCKTFRIQR